MERVYAKDIYNDGRLKRVICHDEKEDWTEESILEHLNFEGHSRVRLSFITFGMERYQTLSNLSNKIDRIFDKREFRRNFRGQESYKPKDYKSNLI